MIPILGVSGYSGAGKTTLVEALVETLTARGHKIAAIKHHHGQLDFDKEGKDSSKLKNKGAIGVALASAKSSVVLRDESEDTDPYEIAERYFPEADIVIAEGYKTRRIPKIVIVGDSAEDIELAKQEMCVAVVSDRRLEEISLPKFKRNDVKEIADFIEERFIEKERAARTFLQIDGKRVPMKPFVRDMLDSVVRAMIGSLKDANKHGKIVIFLDK